MRLGWRDQDGADGEWGIIYVSLLCINKAPLAKCHIRMCYVCVQMQLASMNSTLLLHGE